MGMKCGNCGESFPYETKFWGYLGPQKMCIECIAYIKRPGPRPEDCDYTQYMRDERAVIQKFISEMSIQ